MFCYVKQNYKKSPKSYFIKNTKEVLISPLNAKLSVIELKQYCLFVALSFIVLFVYFNGNAAFLLSNVTAATEKMSKYFLNTNFVIK